ncbi:hypothetical protein ACHAQA_005443 [Verticillium albo-atrum]
MTTRPSERSRERADQGWRKEVDTRSDAEDVLHIRPLLAISGPVTKRKTADKPNQSDETDDSLRPRAKKAKTNHTRGWTRPTLKKLTATIETTANPPVTTITSGPPLYDQVNATKDPVSPSLLSPSEIKIAHVKKGFKLEDETTAALARDILNIVSLVQRLNKFQPGDSSRYVLLGHIITRLDKLDVGLIDETMANRDIRAVRSEWKRINEQLRAVEQGARKLFNQPSVEIHARGLARLIAYPEKHRQGVAARCESIFIHSQYPRAFAVWLRELDRFARLEHRYFEAVSQVPQQIVEGGGGEVWAV